jgi:hypothetical protein
MRTPRYLPGVRNGVVAKRQGRSKNPSTSKALGMGRNISGQRRNSRRFSNHEANSSGRRRSEGRGAKVMWLMILIGMGLAAGFVFALRSQINAYRIAQAEEQLKSQLDEYTRQQKFLAVDQQRAMNAGDSDRAGRWNGLEHLKLDREAIRHDASAQRIVSATVVRSPEADQNNRVDVRPVMEDRNGPRAIKTSQAKAAKLVKSVKTGKNARVVSVVKLNSANKAKANRKRQ